MLFSAVVVAFLAASAVQARLCTTQCPSTTTETLSPLADQGADGDKLVCLYQYGRAHDAQSSCVYEFKHSPGLPGGKIPRAKLVEGTAPDCEATAPCYFLN